MLKRLLPIGLGMMVLFAAFAFAEVNDAFYHHPPQQTWLVTEEDLANRVAELKADVQTIRADLQALRAENQDLRARVQALQEDLQARLEREETKTTAR